MKLYKIGHFLFMIINEAVSYWHHNENNTYKQKGNNDLLLSKLSTFFLYQWSANISRISKFYTLMWFPAPNTPAPTNQLINKPFPVWSGFVRICRATSRTRHGNLWSTHISDLNPQTLLVTYLTSSSPSVPYQHLSVSSDMQIQEI